MTLNELLQTQDYQSEEIKMLEAIYSHGFTVDFNDRSNVYVATSGSDKLGNCATISVLYRKLNQVDLLG
jgi:hypothetical protein